MQECRRHLSPMRQTCRQGREGSLCYPPQRRNPDYTADIARQRQKHRQDTLVSCRSLRRKSGPMHTRGRSFRSCWGRWEDERSCCRSSRRRRCKHTRNSFPLHSPACWRQSRRLSHCLAGSRTRYRTPHRTRNRSHGRPEVEVLAASSRICSGTACSQRHRQSRRRRSGRSASHVREPNRPFHRNHNCAR